MTIIPNSIVQKKVILKDATISRLYDPVQISKFHILYKIKKL